MGACSPREVGDIMGKEGQMSRVSTAHVLHVSFKRGSLQPHSYSFVQKSSPRTQNCKHTQLPTPHPHPHPPSPPTYPPSPCCGRFVDHSSTPHHQQPHPPPHPHSQTPPHTHAHSHPHTFTSTTTTAHTFTPTSTTHTFTPKAVGVNLSADMLPQLTPPLPPYNEAGRARSALPREIPRVYWKVWLLLI